MKYLFPIVAAISIASLYGQTGVSIFNDTYVHKIEIDFPQFPNWYDTLYNDFNSNFYDYSDYLTGVDKKYFSGTVTIDGTIIDSVGVRFKGESSFTFSNEKKSFKLDFNEFVSGQKYDGLKKLNLQNNFVDPSMMRDKISYDLLNEIGTVSPRASHSEVYVNNVYYGLYTVVEQIDKTFLKENFDNSKGDLFKIRQHLFSLADTTLGGTNIVDFFDPKNNDTLNYSNKHLIKYPELRALMYDIYHTNDNDLFDSLNAHFNYDQYLKILAVEQIISDHDCHISRGRNYYVYQNEDTKKFEFLPWDYNLTFTAAYYWNTDSLHPIGLPFPTGDAYYTHDISGRIDDNLQLTQNYLQEVCAVLNIISDTASFFDKIITYHEMIKPFVYADNMKETSNTQFDSSLFHHLSFEYYNSWPYETDGLLPFFRLKINAINTNLFDFGYQNYCQQFLTKKEIVLDEYEVQIYPSLFTSYINIKSGSHTDIEQIEIYDVFGNLVEQQNRGNLSWLNLSHLSNGIYLIHLHLRDSNQAITKKIVKI